MTETDPQPIVHIAVGTFAANYYRTACGLSDGAYFVTRYATLHLATCSECIATFKKED